VSGQFYGKVHCFGSDIGTIKSHNDVGMHVKNEKSRNPKHTLFEYEKTVAIFYLKAYQ